MFTFLSPSDRFTLKMSFGYFLGGDLLESGFDSVLTRVKLWWLGGGNVPKSWELLVDFLGRMICWTPFDPVNIIRSHEVKVPTNLAKLNGKPNGSKYFKTEFQATPKKHTPENTRCWKVHGNLNFRPDFKIRFQSHEFQARFYSNSSLKSHENKMEKTCSCEKKNKLMRKNKNVTREKVGLLPRKLTCPLKSREKR